MTARSRLTCRPCPSCRVGEPNVTSPTLARMQARCTRCGWFFTVRPPLWGHVWGLRVLTASGRLQPPRGWPMEAS